MNLITSVDEQLIVSAVLVIRFEIVNESPSENEFTVHIYLLLTLKSKKKIVFNFLLSYYFFLNTPATTEAFIALWEEFHVRF
jgi:hypothetical protein